jgi:peroxiredoxin
LIELGYQILCISPDKPEKVAEFNKKGEYAYTLLSDAKMDAAKRFGLAFETKSEDFQMLLEEHSGETHHLLPVPAVFIVDRKAKIQFQYVNPDYKIRIDPQTVLAAARASAKR